MKMRFLVAAAAGMLLAAGATFASAAELTVPAPQQTDTNVTLAGKSHGPGMRSHRGFRHGYRHGYRYRGPYFFFGPGLYYGDDEPYYSPYSCYRRCRIYHGPRYCHYRCRY
jgi:hypothetical protein